MQIDECAQIDAEEWDAAVQASDDTWLFHTAAWIEMTASVWALQNRYFVARQNGRIVGGFPVQVDRQRRWSPQSRTAYSTKMGSGGPFATGDPAGRGRQRLLSALSDAVLEWAHKERMDALECLLPPLAPNNLNSLRGVNPLVLLGWDDVSTHTRIVDLSRSESELWSSLADDARQSVRAAETAGYTVARADWTDVVDDYYRIHEATYHRTGVQPHPRAYFERIAATIAARGQSVLWVCRDSQGQPVAFHNCARFRDGALYWTGCSLADHMNKGVNYLLVWRALQGAKQDGCHAYEIGEAFPGVASGKLKGLTLFKSKFGGELHRCFRGEIRCPTPRWRPLARGLLRLPAGVLRRLGRLIAKRPAERGNR